MDNTTQNKLADMFAKRFEDYNEKVLKDLAEIIKQFDGLNYSQASKLAQQSKYDKSYIDLVDELSKLTKKSKKDIKKVLEETIKQHTEFADIFFKARNMETPIYETDLYLQELVNGVAKVSEGDFTNIAKSTGFAFLDKTGDLKFLNMQETYYKVIDECVYAVSLGKETYQEAIRKTINQLVKSGVRRIVYSNDGKKTYSQRLDTAVRRNVLDGIRQISIETQKEFGKRFNADGIEVTVHSNPAPDHENVQGKQFSNKEFDKFQNDTNCYSYDGEFFPAESEETGHDRRSIGQYNCYHTVFSIILGVSDPLYTKKELQDIKEKANEKIEIDGKEYTRYEATQLQRNIETQLRYEKELQMMYLETGDREEAEKHQLNITRLTRKYKEISKEAGIREQLGRASVSGYKAIKTKEVEKLNVSNKNIINFNKNKDSKVLYLGQINLQEKDIINNKIKELRESILYDENEYAYIIDKFGDIFKVKGERSKVDIPEWLNQKDAIVLHNHPKGVTNYSFSKEDVDWFMSNGIKELYGDDLEYQYVIKTNKNTYNIEKLSEDWRIYHNESLDLSRDKKLDIEKDGFDYVVKKLSKKYDFYYKRKLQTIKKK